MLVYVAGPITHGQHESNLRAAIDFATEVLDLGHSPIVPHLTTLMELVHPRPYERWMKYDFELIKRCDVLVRLPGKSSGSDRELMWAIENSITTFVNPEAALEYLKGCK